jgi:hypothetical protein
VGLGGVVGKIGPERPMYELAGAVEKLVRLVKQVAHIDPVLVKESLCV